MNTRNALLQNVRRLAELSNEVRALKATVADLRRELRGVKSERDDAVHAATSGHDVSCICSWCERLRALTGRTPKRKAKR